MFLLDFSSSCSHALSLTRKPGGGGGGEYDSIKKTGGGGAGLSELDNLLAMLSDTQKSQGKSARFDA